MKVAVIGSRGLTGIEIKKYLPTSISLIISGGAKGIDTLAEKFADERSIDKLIILPNYERYGKKAPLVRNKLIIDAADLIIALWDGESRGTKYAIDYARRIGKNVVVHVITAVG